jgi:hypothetical protein
LQSLQELNERVLVILRRDLERPARLVRFSRVREDGLARCGE